MEITYFADYPTKPIGKGNPYDCCASCGVSVPEINGSLVNHRRECAYRIQKCKELGIKIWEDELTSPNFNTNKVNELITLAQNDGDAIHYYNRAFAERLVDLVIRECIETIQRNTYRNGNTPENLRSYDHIKQIKDHFGIDYD